MAEAQHILAKEDLPILLDPKLQDAAQFVARNLGTQATIGARATSCASDARFAAA